MLTSEQAKILNCLQRSMFTTIDHIAATCMPGASPAWVARVVADLEWLGYVVVYNDESGTPLTIEMTERGTHVAV